MFKSVSIMKNGAEFLLPAYSHPDGFLVEKVDGLGSAPADISTEYSAYRNRTFYRRSQLQYRNIVITVKLRNNPELQREAIYPFLVPGDAVVLRLTTDRITRFARGYVEKVDIDQFTDDNKMTISVICPDSFLDSGYVLHTPTETQYSNQPAFEFRYQNAGLDPNTIFGRVDTGTNSGGIYNRGHAPAPWLAKITALRNNYTLSLVQVGQASLYFDTNRVVDALKDARGGGIKFTAFNAGDYVYVDNTIEGRRVTAYLNNGSRAVNITHALQHHSKYGYIQPGRAYVGATGSNADRKIEVTYAERYVGL